MNLKLFHSCCFKKWSYLVRKTYIQIFYFLRTTSRAVALQPLRTSRPFCIGHLSTNELQHCNCWYDSLPILDDYHSHVYRKIYSHMLVQYHTCHSWHPVLLLNLFRILPLFLLLLAISMIWHDLTTDIPVVKNPFSVTLGVPKNHQNLWPCATLCSMTNYFCLAGNCQPAQSWNWRSVIVSCPWLLMWHTIKKPLPYQETVASTHNLRIHCAVLTRGPLNNVISRQRDSIFVASRQYWNHIICIKTVLT